MPQNLVANGNYRIALASMLATNHMQMTSLDILLTMQARTAQTVVVLVLKIHATSPHNEKKRLPYLTAAVLVVAYAHCKRPCFHPPGPQNLCHLDATAASGHCQRAQLARNDDVTVIWLGSEVAMHATFSGATPSDCTSNFLMP